MVRIVAPTINELYCRSIDAVFREGYKVSPRGMATVELLSPSLVLTRPDWNVLTIPERAINYQFQVAEWLWIMFGRNDVDTIAPYNRNIAKFSDDGVRFFGAYGPKFLEQLSYAVSTLRNDPHSRQAIISLWRERPAGTRDIPCTLSFQFLLRHGELNMITTMRSNDVWLGFPYDLFTFTQIQRYIALALGVQVGQYVHNAGSFHLYEEHFEKAQQVANLHCNPFLEIPEGIPSPALTRMPLWVETYFVGLAHQEPAIMEELLSTWVRDGEEDSEVWFNYLKVLAYRFHRRVEDLPPLYQDLHRNV